jgi:8-oxo-dGTP diphosphatase
VREPDNTVLVVAAVLVDDLDLPSRLLAARRTGPPAIAGGWEFPGGKVEPGESPLAALHRELAEELGVRIRVGAEVAPATSKVWPISERLEMRVWLAEIVDGEPRTTDDHDQLRWLSADELFDVAWLPADVSLVRALRSLLCHGPAAE